MFLSEKTDCRQFGHKAVLFWGFRKERLCEFATTTVPVMLAFALPDGNE